MNVYACRTFIEDYIDTRGGHVLRDLQLVIRRPETETVNDDLTEPAELTASTVLEFKYWMYNVASNAEVVGQSKCTLNGGAATPRVSEWEYADGSTVALEDVYRCAVPLHDQCRVLRCDVGAWETAGT
jgi:hypothetical protein